MTSKLHKRIPKSIRIPTMNYIRFAAAGLIIMLGWNTLSAGMRAVKALDQRAAAQLELLAE